MLSPSKSTPLKREANDLETSSSTPTIQVQHDPICGRCSQIDFRAVLNLNRKILIDSGKQGILVKNFGRQLADAAPQACALCNLFKAVAIPSLGTEGHEKYELRAYSVLRFSRTVLYQNYSKKSNQSIGKNDQPYLAVVSSTGTKPDLAHETAKVGQVFCYMPQQAMERLFSPQLVPPYLKSSTYSSVLQWIKYCKENHGKLCGKKEPQLQGLKVIDCKSMCVVHAPPSCLYVALSYVWGKSSETGRRVSSDSSNATGLLPQPLPKTVDNAVKCTKELNFQYLWVDEFCINQNDQAEKDYQIGRMDVIYNGAELTIVATAGEDKEFGLPGVDADPRTAQPQAMVGEIQVVSSMMHPHLAIQSSKWSRRGWTFQEGVLSPRRLVFTKEQIYFECNAMNFCESLRLNVDLSHSRNKGDTNPLFHKGILGRRQRNPFGRSNSNQMTRHAAWDQYARLIEGFAGMELTDSNDIGKAFAGIASSLARSHHPYFHIHGIPFPMPLPTETPEDDRTHLARSLLWVPDADDSPHCRRPGFPSWSWTGWFGSVRFLDRTAYFETKLSGIWFEFETGRKVEQSSFLRGSKLDELYHSSPRALHLDTLLAPSDLLTVEDGAPPQWRFEQGKVKLCLSLGRHDPQYILEMITTQKWLMAVVGVRYEDREVIYLMVIEQAFNFATRIGMIKAKFHRGADVNVLLNKMERGRISLT